ncbi:MAG TPA: hypothetical protein VNA89_16145 [Gemmatimonadaceae bacterium]|nr:hypothetical protein [Gemmatimonadaceae bacterium]
MKTDPAQPAEVQRRAALLLADRHLVARLRELGALSPASAQPPPRLGRLGPLRRLRLRRLLTAGAVREADSGGYYLDEAAYASWCGVEQARLRERMRRAAVASAALALAVALGLLFLM